MKYMTKKLSLLFLSFALFISPMVHADWRKWAATTACFSISSLSAYYCLNNIKKIYNIYSTGIDAVSGQSIDTSKMTILNDPNCPQEMLEVLNETFDPNDPNIMNATKKNIQNKILGYTKKSIFSGLMSLSFGYLGYHSYKKL